MSDLVARFQAGDPDAIRTLYREYGGAVHTVAISIVHDRELAAEVVQQTFLKAWRGAGSFDVGRELAPWLYSIARHAAIDALRAEARRSPGGHPAQLDDDPVDPRSDGESMERAWEQFEVRRAVDSLPPDEREVVRRSHLLGQTHEQIAEQLGVPVGTVKSRSARAHKKLIGALTHLAGDHPTANRPAASGVLIDEEPR